MSLNYNITQIDDKYCWNKIPQSQLNKEEKEKADKPNVIPIFSIPRTERKDGKKHQQGVYEMNTELYVIIFLSMQIGINKFTKKNIHKVYNRINFMERLNENGFMTTGKGKNKESVPFTLEMLENYIGLETNVSNLTKSQFIKMQTKRFDV